MPAGSGPGGRLPSTAAATSRVPRVARVFAATAATWIWQMRYPLHVGEFAGPVVRMLWVLVALMPAAFVISGFWLYGSRRRYAWAVKARG